MIDMKRLNRFITSLINHMGDYGCSICPLDGDCDFQDNDEEADIENCIENIINNYLKGRTKR